MTDDRLFEAAEMAVRAAIEYARFTGGAVPWPPDLVGIVGCPVCLLGFTEDEVEAGSMFMYRLGILAHRKGVEK